MFPIDRHLRRWQTPQGDLAFQDVEFIVGTIAPVVATFQVLKQIERRFDSMLTKLRDKLRMRLRDAMREGCIDIEDPTPAVAMVMHHD